MRVITLAVAAILAVCAADATLDSALAAKKKKPMVNSSQSLRPDFDKCEQKANQAGAPAGQSGHREYMMQCLYGVVTGRPTGD